MLIKLEKEVKENLNFVSRFYRDAYWIDKQIPNIIAFEKFKIQNGIDEMFRRNDISLEKYVKFNGKPSEELIEKRETFLLLKSRKSKAKFNPKHLETFTDLNKIKLKKSHYDKYMKGMMRKVKNEKKIN